MFKFNIDKASKLTQIILFSILIGYFVLMVIQYFAGIIALLVSAGFIAFLSSEMIKPMVKRGLSVNGSMAIVYTAIISTFILSFIIMIPLLIEQGTELIGSIPQTISSIENTIEGFFSPFEKYGWKVDFNKLAILMQDRIQAGILRATTNFPNIIIDSFSIIISIVISIVIAIYLVKDFDRMWASFIKKTGKNSARWEYVRLELTKSLRGFVKGQIYSGAYMMAATTVIYLLVGLRFGLVASFTLGIMETIPYFGAFIGMIPVALLALSQNFTMFVVVMVLTLIAQQIKDNILYPRWMGDSIGIHPLGVFLSILIGGKVAGILGIFLAIPIAGLIQAVMRVIFSDEDFQPIVDEAMSNENT